MKRLVCLGTLLLSGCSNDTSAPDEPIPHSSTIPEDNMGSGNIDNADDKGSGTATPGNDGIIYPSTPTSEVPAPNPNPETMALFQIDPDSLSFPVVFHLGQSTVWKDEESLKPVVAEIQRILAQAKLEIIPSYTQSEAFTSQLDISYVPSVPNEGSSNAGTYDDADLEVFVRDVVSLTKVDDKRPVDVSAVRTLRGAKPGDLIRVGQAAAKLARTTAHTIGHQLGLEHREDSSNLLASGKTGWLLNSEEIATLRTNAVKKFGAKYLPKIEAASPAALASDL